jgi:hypothetical protein
MNAGRVLMAGAMLIQPGDGNHLRKLQGEVRRAQNVTRPLMADVLATIGARHCTAPSAAPARRVQALLDAEAWTDAALALLDLALPQWKLRRLAYEDGEWRCCLGSQWPLPEWLDDIVEVGHPVLPLAILDALIEALAVTRTSPRAARNVVPSVPLAPCDTSYLCCDNFSQCA